MDVDVIYNKYSKINPYRSKGLVNYKKIVNKTIYYFVPFWLSKFNKNEWKASFRLTKSLKDEINKQIYYDLVCLGISSTNDRPKCKYCNNDSKFSLNKGYLDYCNCKICERKHASELISKRLKGRPLSKEHRKKLSLAKKGKKLTEKQRLRRPRGYHFHLSVEAREKISKSKKGKVMSRSYYKSGTYRSTKCIEDIKYLSSYERDFLKICDYSKFISCIEIPEPIQYNYSGESHNYYPDFIITTESGMKVMVEVKAKNLVNNSKVIAKRLAGKKWCKCKGIKYITLTENNIYTIHKHKKVVNLDMCIYDYVV